MMTLSRFLRPAGWPSQRESPEVAVTALSRENLSRLLEDGRVRGYVNVFVDDEDVRYLGGLDAPVGDAAEVTIMPAVAGGAR